MQPFNSATPSYIAYIGKFRNIQIWSGTWGCPSQPKWMSFQRFSKRPLTPFERRWEILSYARDARAMVLVCTVEVSMTQNLVAGWTYGLTSTWNGDKAEWNILKAKGWKVDGKHWTSQYVVLSSHQGFCVKSSLNFLQCVRSRLWAPFLGSMTLPREKVFRQEPIGTGRSQKKWEPVGTEVRNTGILSSWGQPILGQWIFGFHKWYKGSFSLVSNL